MCRSTRSLASSRQSLGAAQHHGVVDEALKPVEEEDGRRGEDDSSDATRALVQQHQHQGSRRNSRRLRTASESSGRGVRRSSDASGGAKPFYRDDIFFSASLARLPQYTSQVSPLALVSDQPLTEQGPW
ncbi:hypothetical protein PR048_009525 [Dryococelus australis]|uniref:Uncharacterized protein n=1 Tax=Dryococelus australis TaxID=614101 RepID=A0ABQ9I130_9NEOP|nr:hypothetical protein PR048_009525 [Dryococelus australis]